MSVVVERKYRMIRVRSGVYLLPSNDRETLWRISAYEEDGSAEWQDDAGKWHVVRGTYWETARRSMPTEEIPDSVDMDEWLWDSEAWSWQTMGHKTRREAIEAALRDGLNPARQSKRSTRSPRPRSPTTMC